MWHSTPSPAADKINQPKHGGVSCAAGTGELRLAPG